MVRFSQDKRVLMWDLYNEPGAMWRIRGEKPGNYNKGYTGSYSLPLLNDVYKWARQVNPSQPITTCWNKGAYEAYAAITRADIITFHHYGDVKSTENLINKIQEKVNYRPIICTEYLNRQNYNRFETHLPLFKKYNIGAINWGLVSGKTNTIWEWKTWDNPSAKEPEIWFHDIFRKDGTPFDKKEIIFIQSMIKNS